jgi:hypothetical protein
MQHARTAAIAFPPHELPRLPRLDLSLQRLVFGFVVLLLIHLIERSSGLISLDLAVTQLRSHRIQLGKPSI